MTSTTKRGVLKEATYSPVSKDDKPFTHKEANRALNMTPFVGDRPLNENRVLDYAALMESGDFQFENASIAVVYCEETKKWYRVNGKHTCTARLLLDGPVPKIRVVRYRVATMEDVRRLYTQFDPPEASRTSREQLDARTKGVDAFEGITNTVRAKLAAGLRMWYGRQCRNELKQSSRLITMNETADLMLNEHYRLCMHVAPMIDRIIGLGPIAHSFNRSPVHGAMFATFNKVVGASNTFWEKVITGLGFESSVEPAKVLRDWLQTHTTTAGGNNSISREDMYRGCLVAFNKLREDKPLRVIRVGALKSRPKVK